MLRYGPRIASSGYDSEVYLEHFKSVKSIDTSDYKLIA